MHKIVPKYMIRTPGQENQRKELGQLIQLPMQQGLLQKHYTTENEQTYDSTNDHVNRMNDYFYFIIEDYNQLMQCHQHENKKQNISKICLDIDKTLDQTNFINTPLLCSLIKQDESINLIKIFHHNLPSNLQNPPATMDYSDEQFNQIITKLQFKKNEPFKSDPKNLSRIIDYIEKMAMNQNSFEVVEYLIKEFGISILYCFQPFYKRIINDLNAQKKYESQLQRISALVLYTINFGKYGELKFFSIAGTAKKGFKLKQKTPEELQFVQDIDFIRTCLILKKENPQIQALPKDRLQKLIQIRQKVKTKKVNPFMSFYLTRMIGNVNKQFKFEKIQGSTADQEPEVKQFKKKHTPSPTVDCAKLPSLTQNQTVSPNQINIKQINPIPQIQQNPNDAPIKFQTPGITSEAQIPTTKAQKFSQPSTKDTGKTSTIESYDLTTQYTNDEEEQKIKRFRKEKQQMQRLQKEKKQKKADTAKGADISKNLKANSSKNDFLEDTRDQTANTLNFTSSEIAVNFALIPLCCRNYFFDQEKILPAEDKRTQYKSYRFPFNPASIETFKKTICAFLNTIGGQIYIGIKETTNKKYRYILGNYLSENDKEEVLKSFRKISEQIYPNVLRDLVVEFVPVRKSPFPQLNILEKSQVYSYDFSKKGLKLDNCPYKPARYVIRVRIPMGVREEMYSYIETEYQLNKNSNSNQFIPFRSQNEVLVKEISQEVLKKFRQKLIRGNQKGWEIHKGDCKKPDIGNPRNEPEPPEEMMDPKQIQAPLANQKRRQHLQGKLQSITQDSREDTTSQYPTSQQNNMSTISNTSKVSQSNELVTEKELLKIFKYPLRFIVLRMSKDRLKKCIDKTPAKDYTEINLEKNDLNGQDLLIIKVNTYSYMEQFLRIKEKLQNHFQKDRVEFVGVSKILKLQNFQNRRIAEQILTKNDHNHAFNNKNLQFYSVRVAASYLLYMRQLGYRVQAIPD